MDMVRDVELYALAAGALDPARARVLEARLRASPALQRRYAALRARLDAPLEPLVEDEGWRIPPRPLGGLSVASSPALVMGEERRYRVRLEGAPAGAERWLLVLRREAGGPWRCVFPEHEDDLVPLSALPRDGDALLFELSAEAELADPEWAVLLPEAGVAVDWSAPPAERWSALLPAVLRGELPMVRVRLEPL